MSKSASATIAVTVTGDGMNLSDSDTILNPTGVAPTSFAMVAGLNTILVPAGVMGVKICPPPGNTIGLLLGVSGSGVPISASSPSYLSLPTGTSAIGITAGGDFTLLFVWV